MAIAFMAGILSGCPMTLGYLYTFNLDIENKLAIPIARCISNQISDCPYTIKSHDRYNIHYISGKERPTDQEMYETFDLVNIKICNKLVKMKDIRLTSPILKQDDDHFNIIIDERVNHAFCH
jgi:hypothetical protein